MAETTTMTVRIDAELKAAIDAAARSQGLSTTEYNERALKTALHTTCTTCGRSSVIGAALPGFSPQFEQWIAEAKGVAVNQPILIITIEEGQQWVYWCKLRDATPMTDGALMLKVFTDRSRRGQDFAMPRGIIVGYRSDSEGYWYNNQILLGSKDGNARLIQRLTDFERSQQASMVPPPRGGRSR